MAAAEGSSPWRCSCWNVTARLAGDGGVRDADEASEALLAVQAFVADARAAEPERFDEAPCELGTAEMSMAGSVVKNQALVREEVVLVSAGHHWRCIVCENCDSFVFAEPCGDAYLTASSAGGADEKSSARSGFGQLRDRLFGGAAQKKPAAGATGGGDAVPALGTAAAGAGRAAGGGRMHGVAEILVNQSLAQFETPVAAAEQWRKRRRPVSSGDADGGGPGDCPEEQQIRAASFVWSPAFEMFVRQSAEGSNALIECPEPEDEEAFSSFQELSDQLQESLQSAAAEMERRIEEFKLAQQAQFMEDQQQAYTHRKLLWHRMCGVHAEWDVVRPDEDGAQPGEEIADAAPSSVVPGVVVAGMPGVEVLEAYDGEQHPDSRPQSTEPTQLAGSEIAAPSAESVSEPVRGSAMAPSLPESGKPPRQQQGEEKIAQRPESSDQVGRDDRGPEFAVTQPRAGSSGVSKADNSESDMFALDDELGSTSPVEKFLGDDAVLDEQDRAEERKNTLILGAGAQVRPEGFKRVVVDEDDEARAWSASQVAIPAGQGGISATGGTDLMGTSMPVRVPTRAERSYTVGASVGGNDAEVALSLKLLAGEDVMRTHIGKGRRGFERGRSARDAELDYVEDEAAENAALDEDIYSKSFDRPQSMNRRQSFLA